ncbi:protein translocase subunit SecD [Candidatus Woesearchaeota archaeon]|nr:protein translocase subunit SecD [Candidatus Woesearchaeota archaeon]
MKLRKILKQPRVMILLFVLLSSFIAIGHQFESNGVSISFVEKNSTAEIYGMENPESNIQPVKREKIIEINKNKILNLKDYATEISKIKEGETIEIKTNKGTYTLLKDEKDLGITVTEASTSNIRKGLELQGGTQVLLKPEKEITDQEIKDIIDTMENRLNVYGLSDLKIKEAKDLTGEKYILIEIAGATKEEVKDLIGSQGNFEAKIGNEVVFKGGKQDITFVCRNDGTCSRISQCNPSAGGFGCQFEFEISLSNDAAQKHAEITKNLEIITSEGGSRVLEKNIDFYLDGKQVDSLQISESLKGQKATRITISGPGLGVTEAEAINNAIKNRDKLQTVLITGSLPTKLEIIKLDYISPTLGKSFLNNAILVGILAALAVGLVIFIRYRKLKIAIPIVLVVLSEIYLILGLSALFKYNLDLAAIAGIIASVGTGVDDQIVITDEVLSKSQSAGNWKNRIKNAFFIILIAYATTVAAMLPLLRTGAGLLTGFALVTIAGVTIGVFITRPAFASIIKVLLEE